MMAASVVGTGSGAMLESCPQILPSHNSSLHEHSLTAPSSAATSTTTTASATNVAIGDEESEERGLDSTTDNQSLSPAGKRLAESSPSGQSASENSTENLPGQEDEKKIALSQLQELEVAIEVRKVTKVDGRKTRWIEYRLKKQVDTIEKRQKRKPYKKIDDEDDQMTASFENLQVQVKETIPNPREKVRKKVKRPSIKVKQLKKFIKSQPKRFETKVISALTQNNDCQKVDDVVNNNNSSNNNNNSSSNNNLNITSSMKAEVTNTNPMGTTITVLETMKQQFLEDTFNVMETPTIISKTKTMKKKVAKAAKSSSPLTNGKFNKKAKGRPKKLKVSKLAKKSSSVTTSKTKVPVVSHANHSSDAEDSSSLASPMKSKNFQGVSQSINDFYSRRNNSATRGLREVRKSESGSESGSSSPLKESYSPSSHLSPAMSLAISPIPLGPSFSEGGSTGGHTKCPLIAAAAKALSSKLEDQDAKKKKVLKKGSKREPANKNLKVLNGHSGTITNGSAKYPPDKKEADADVLNGVTNKVVISTDQPPVQKRPRGRPRLSDSAKYAKKTATIIADVHNTMNGEPQMVIPINNPVINSRKKKSSPNKPTKNPSNVFISTDSQAITEIHSHTLDASSNKENAYFPTVPDNSSNSSSLILSPSKKIVTSSASRLSSVDHLESGQLDSTNSDCLEGSCNDVKFEKVPDHKEILTAVPNGSTVIDENEENLDDSFTDSVKNESAEYISQSNELSSSSHMRQRTILEFTKSFNMDQTKGSSFSSPAPITSKESLLEKAANMHESTEYSHAKVDNDEGLINGYDSSSSVNSLVSNHHSTIGKRPSQMKLLKGIPKIIKKTTPTKYTKVKSLNAVIEKLQSPLAQDPLNSEKCHDTDSDMVKDEYQYISEMKIEETFLQDSSLSNPSGDTSDKKEELKAMSDKVFQKSKDKVPRILKQLFQDEGVQNMLRSMNEDNASDISTNIDSTMHKLRPKRANENFMADSPEPEEPLIPQGAKRKKRFNEVDNLFVDEGALNLLTSIESSSRRMSTAVEDTSSETSQVSFKSTLSSKPEYLSIDSHKRKLGGASSGIAGRKLQLQESKRPKLEPGEVLGGNNNNINDYNLQVDKHNSTQSRTEPTIIKKKLGRPAFSTMGLKQKSKLQLQMLKKQMKRLGIKENMTVSQVKDLLDKRKKAAAMNNQTSKAVPPLKIKLSQSQEHHGTSSSSVSSAPFATEQSKYSIKSLQGSKFARPNLLSRPNNPSTKSIDSAKAPLRDGAPKTMTEKMAANNAAVLNRPMQKLNPTGSNISSPPIVSLVPALDSSDALQKVKHRFSGEGLRQSQRTSVRQTEGTYHYRDIQLRKFVNFTQIIMTPSTTKMKNALNSRVLHELCEALSTLRRDDTVRMVLLTATGPIFCQGIDLTALQHPNSDTRKKNADNLIRGIREFLRCLLQFPKMIVAGVNGDAMGLGVTMLPLFDLVIATDKAEFYLPYGKLGQVPEGGATYTFPYFFGKLQSTKLFLGHKITATEALQIGLASEVLWPATYLQELLPKVASLATQSVQSMEATKALMNHHLMTKLELSVESECRLLLQHWMSPTFTNLCKRFMESHHIQLQKPVILPL